MFFFDMDGTLIDSNGIWRNVDETFLARRGFPYSRAYYEGVAHTILPLAAQFTKEFCGLFESCESIIAEWMDLAGELYAEVKTKPGVRAYLEQCRAEGRRMAIVTSSVPEHCHMALRHLGLETYFDSLIFAQELSLEKRSPEIWRTAAQKHGTLSDACTVFDDSLSACRGAHAAGMRVVGVSDPYFTHDEEEMRSVCDIYIKSFEELLYMSEQQGPINRRPVRRTEITAVRRKEADD